MRWALTLRSSLRRQSGEKKSSDELMCTLQSTERKIKMANIEEMRAALKYYTKYSKSAEWQRKVTTMSNRQVIAVYLRLMKEGEIK